MKGSVEKWVLASSGPVETGASESSCRCNLEICFIVSCGGGGVGGGRVYSADADNQRHKVSMG